MVGGTLASGRRTPSYVTPACLGVPKNGNKIRSSYFTCAFSGARKWAELLRYPCILGGPQKRGQNEK